MREGDVKVSGCAVDRASVDEMVGIEGEGKGKKGGNNEVYAVVSTTQLA